MKVKPDIFTLLRTGHFHFALTSLSLFIDRMCTLWYMQYSESMRGTGIVSRHQEERFSPQFNTSHSIIYDFHS